MIIAITVASTLLITLYRFNENIQQINTIEDERSHEKIIISDITVVNGIMTAITIQNLGSVTSQIKAFYVNDQLICDPSEYSLNSNKAYINAQDSRSINVLPTIFNIADRITIATARGIKAIELESNFQESSSSTTEPPDTYYGPLRLNFTLFYYRTVDGTGNPIGPWEHADHIPSNVTECSWNITVTNIDTRHITLSGYSSLTLVTNEGGGQKPWYTNSPGQFIPANQSVNIIYTWSSPQPCTVAQSVHGINASKVFLTFYGKFSDGTTYGQTIPFSAILRS